MPHEHHEHEHDPERPYAPPHHHDHPAHHAGAHTHALPLIGQLGRAFFIGLVLNLGIVVVEVVYGLVAHSMSLVADAGHNLIDALGLGLAWGASALATRRPSARRTYGLRRVSILAALANAVLLLVATGGIAWQSIERLGSPSPVSTRTMMVVAGAAVVVNAASAWLLAKGRHGDLNVHSAFLHLAADAGVALGVVLTGAAIEITGLYVLDPIMGLVLSVLIVASTWSMVKRSLDLVLDAVPDGIEPGAVRAYLSGLPGVREVHDLHIWAMSTTETALTAHLVMTGTSERCFLSDTSRELHERFHIEHATLQVEPEDAPDPCRLAPEERV